MKLGICALALLCAPGLAQEAKPTLPNRAEARAVCEHVVSRGPAIAASLVKDGVLDANNDGEPDQVSVGMNSGTMRGDVLEFRRRGASKDSPAIEVTTEGFQVKDYLPFGGRWLDYGGKVYTLYFEAEDLRHVSYLGHIDRTNTERLVCDFTNVEREQLKPVAAAAADVCKAVAEKKVRYVAVKEDESLNAGRRATRATARVAVDFRNTGAPTRLALLLYESGAGRGCDFAYFDVISGDEIASSGDAHALLMALQAIKPEQGRSAGRCGGDLPRWFKHGGRVYLDIASKSDASGIMPFHDVMTVRGGRVEAICKGEFRVEWKVNAMGPDFR